VAKRVRGSHSTHRPGGLAPTRSPRPAGSPSLSGGTAPSPTWDADIDGAIDSLVVETTEVTIADPIAPSTPSGRPRRRTAIKADSLEARVAAENVYVREDLRRIAVVTGILLAGLAIAWVLFVALDLLGLY
jgi:hypothetical protein